MTDKQGSIYIEYRLSDTELNGEYEETIIRKSTVNPPMIECVPMIYIGFERGISYV